MKDIYIKCPHGLACIEVTPYFVSKTYQSDWYVNRVYVPAGERRKGLAHKMLSSLTEQADKEQARLFLEPVPYETEIISKDALIALYEKYGFVLFVTDYMRRNPKKEVESGE